VAISDPTNTQALDQIKFQSEASVEPVIVPTTPCWPCWPR
jgi:type IV pilus assembly protein PilB